MAQAIRVAASLIDRTFRQLVKISSNLTSLSLAPFSVSFKLAPDDLRSVFEAAPSLSSLDLRSNHLVRRQRRRYYFRLTAYQEMDPVLIDLANRCPNLTRLAVDGIGVSDNGLQAVLTV